MSDAPLILNPSANESASGSLTEEGRTLPSNVEAEAAFLGAILIDNSVYEELPNPLRPEHFFVPAHRLIMERVLTMMERGATASPVTLKPYFEGSEHLEQLGGTTYLARLTADGHGLLATRQLAGRGVRGRKQRAVIDQQAAVAILQGWLDTTRGT